MAENQVATESPVKGESDGLDLIRVKRRLFYAQEDVRLRPFSCPTGTTWYAEDVPELLAGRDALITAFAAAIVALRQSLSAVTADAPVLAEVAEAD